MKDGRQDEPGIRERRRKARWTAAVLFAVAALVFIGFMFITSRGAG